MSCDICYEKLTLRQYIVHCHEELARPAVGLGLMAVGLVNIFVFSLVLLSG